MTVIQAYNYRVAIDATGTQSGAAITRRELASVRATFRALTDPADRAAHQVDLLRRAMNQGAISSADYESAVAKIRARLPDAVDEQRRLTEAQEKAAAVKRSLMTEDERYRAELQRLAALVKANALSHDEARRALAAYRATLPSAVAAVREKNAAERETQRIQRGLMTDAQRYAAERDRVNKLVGTGGLTQAQANQHLAAYRGTLSSVIAAERERADALSRAAAIVRQNETATERFQRQLRELNQLHRAGAIATRDHAREVIRLRNELSQAGTQSTGATGTMAAALFRLTPAALGTSAALYTVVGAARSVFRESFAMETARSNFEVFTGSVENGQRLYKDLIALSSSSPLSFDHYGNAARQLLGYGAAADRVTPILDRLDDLSTADPQKFASLARVYGQVIAAGRLTGEDLLQFIDAGFNPLQELVAITGEAYADLRKKMSDGAISVDMVTRAIESATSEGGRFFGMIESRGNTAAGAVGRMSAEWQLLKAEVGSIGHRPLAWLSGIAAGGLASARNSITKFSPQVQEIATTFHGMAGDVLEIGEGLLRWDWDRVSSGLAGDKAYENWRRFVDLQKQIEPLPEPQQSTGYVLPFDPVELAARQREIDKATRSEVDALKQRNLELSMGADWAAAYKLQTEGVSETLRDELAALKERNKQLELADQIKQRTDAIERQARLAQDAERIRANGIDTDTAAQMAELREMGAGTEELYRHLQARRELLAIQQRQRADAEQLREFERMKSAADAIRDGQRSPVESLAAEFDRLRSLRAADLLSEQEYQRARVDAARKAAAAMDDPKATRGSSLGTVEAYRELVEAQTERRRKAAEDRRTRQMIANADRVAEADRRRLAVQQLTTRELVRQNLAIEQGAVRGAIATQTPAGPPAVAPELLVAVERIADATERANEHLERIEGVTGL